MNSTFERCPHFSITSATVNRVINMPRKRFLYEKYKSDSVLIYFYYIYNIALN